MKIRATARSHSHRWVSLLLIAMLSIAATTTSSGVAAASTTNRTPDTAADFTAIPYEASADWLETPLATDPAAQRVAAACNGGADIYGTAWWRYTAPSTSTFVVHAGVFVGTVGGYEPTGMAVVSGDLASVLRCGQEGTSISDAGAFTLQSGESAYIVTYLEAPTDATILGPTIGVYRSTGVVPANDAYAAATQIPSLPYAITQDTTVATREPSEPACYSKFGVGPSVWYAVTAARSEKLVLSVSSDYDAQFVIVPPLEDGSTNWLCDTQFTAEAGVTYRIGVYGTDELRNSGRLTFNLSAVPRAPSVRAQIATSATVNKKTGVVKLTGKVTCSGTVRTNPLTGTLSQVYRRVTYQRAFKGTSPACTGRPETWAATVFPSNFRFTRGDVKVSVSVTACNTGGCTTAKAQGKVKLKKA